MSQPTPAPEPSPPPPGETPSEVRRSKSGLVTRIIVWGVVAAAVVVVYLELRARSDYTGTMEAWYDAQKNADGTSRELHRSDLQGLIRGNPREEIDKNPRSFADLARTRGKYTWHGLFRNYTAYVDYGPPDDDPAVQIISPDNPENSDEAPIIRQPAKRPDPAEKPATDDGEPPAADAEQPPADAEQPAEKPES